MKRPALLVIKHIYLFDIKLMHDLNRNLTVRIVFIRVYVVRGTFVIACLFRYKNWLQFVTQTLKGNMLPLT